MSDVNDSDNEQLDDDIQQEEDTGAGMDDDEEKENVDEEEKLIDEEVEEEEEPDAELILNDEMIGECLSLLCKTGDGLAHAYVKFDGKDRELTNINILSSYIHLRYVDLSNNKLRDISSLNNLAHLLTLKVDDNKLTSALLDPRPYLQVASFCRNRIKIVENFKHEQLEHLIMNENRINRVNLDNLKCLHTLELRGNKLTSLSGIQIPTLKNLFVAQNQLTDLLGINNLTGLTTLHLRSNPIEKLDGVTEQLANLQYINMRECLSIPDMKELQKLKVLPNLRAVVLTDTNLSAEDDYRLEVLVCLRRLERLDKDEYTEEERQEAEDVFEQRRQEELVANENVEEVIEDPEEESVAQ